MALAPPVLSLFMFEDRDRLHSLNLPSGKAAGHFSDRDPLKGSSGFSSEREKKKFLLVFPFH